MLNFLEEETRDIPLNIEKKQDFVQQSGINQIFIDRSKGLLFEYFVTP